jgi:FkbM family methyltransferase
VIAIEPDPNNIIALSKNIKQFGDSVIMIGKAASSSNDEKLDFYTSQKGHMSSSIVQRRDNDEKCVVETITLDKVIDLNNIKHVDLLKFDVEGSEYRLFQGLKNKKIVSYIAGELHKDLIPEGFEEFLDQLTLDFDIVDGHHLISDSSVRKPVIFAKNKN